MQVGKIRKNDVCLYLGKIIFSHTDPIFFFLNAFAIFNIFLLFHFIFTFNFFFQISVSEHTHTQRYPR